MIFKKYDIVLGDFNPRKGSAQSGVRPCIVIQNNVFNQKYQTLIVVPLTSVVKKPYPSEFTIKASSINGLTKTSRFLGSQIFTLDTGFISKKLGILETKYHKELLGAISISLDLQDNFIDE